MNRVILMGRLTRDPDEGNEFCRFTIAVDRKVKKEQNVDFIRCVAFGKTSDFILKYFGKGQRILVEGRIQTGSYERNGQKITTTDVIAENVEFCESKPQQETYEQQEFQTVDDDGLPF